MDKSAPETFLFFSASWPHWAQDAARILFIISSFAALLIPIITLLKFFGLWRSHQETKNHGNPEIARIEAIRKRLLTPQEAIQLASAEAGRRFKDESQGFTGAKFSNEFREAYTREFAALATSRNAVEREAAALDASGKTAEAYARLAELARQDSLQAAKHWKSAGVLAFATQPELATQAFQQAICCDPNDIHAHLDLASLQFRLGKIDDANLTYANALKLSSLQPALAARAHVGLGEIAKLQGEFRVAQNHFSKALQLSETSKEPRATSRALIGLGTIHSMTGKLNEAIVCFKRSAQISQSVNEVEMVAASYGNLGVSYYSMGDFGASQTYLQKSLDLAIDAHDDMGAAKCLGNLGVLEAIKGNSRKAISRYRSALAIFKKVGSFNGIACQYRNLGTEEHERKNIGRALILLRAALEIFEKQGDRREVARVLGNLGALHAERGETEIAIQTWTTAISIFQEIGDKEAIPTLAENIRKANIRRQFKQA